MVSSFQLCNHRSRARPLVNNNNILLPAQTGYSGIWDLCASTGPRSSAGQSENKKHSITLLRLQEASCNLVSPQDIQQDSSPPHLCTLWEDSLSDGSKYIVYQGIRPVTLGRIGRLGEQGDMVFQIRDVQKVDCITGQFGDNRAC